MTKFVPDDYVVPQRYSHADFRLEILEPGINHMDYEAVMSSRENLRRVFAENDTWPADDMTPEENLNDLIIHEKEFKNRVAFAYTVLTLDKSKCIGCIYIEPCNRAGIDAEIYFWLRDDALHLETPFFKDIKNWIATKWPFKKVAWPGREIPWKNWGKRSHSHS